MNWLSGSKTPHTGRGTWHIIARKASVLGAALLLSGCGLLSLAYNQLPNLSYWWLDDYFDFNTAQSTQVRNGLDALALWHKQNELQPYATLLDQASTLATNGFTAEQACQWMDTATARVDALVAQAAPLAVPVMASLTAAQLAHYQGYIDERNEQWQDEQLRASPQDQLAFRLERSLKQLERFYGRLSTEQQAQVSQLLASSSYQASEAFERRTANQARLWAWLQAVQQAPVANHGAMAQGLLDVWHTSKQWPQARRLQWCEQVVAFHDIMSPAQRQTASETLAAYAQDLRAIASK
ncbi:MAG: DUF6279 family lipoprotein [Burkholderiaceae bacterium]|jgi:hypothetical protein|nr:DUF6279 family lipoprotein [Burkholderiaceae bacterium]